MSLIHRTTHVFVEYQGPEGRNVFGGVLHMGEAPPWKNDPNTQQRTNVDAYISLPPELGTHNTFVANLQRLQFNQTIPVTRCFIRTHDSIYTANLEPVTWEISRSILPTIFVRTPTHTNLAGIIHACHERPPFWVNY